MYSVYLRIPKDLYVFTSGRSLGNGKIGSGSLAAILLIEDPVESYKKKNYKQF